MFFIVTTGRSGSTTIARVLSQHPLCVCSHEQHRILIKLSAERCHGQVEDEEIQFYLTGMFPHRVGLQLYGESNQRLSYLIPLLSELNTNPKFLWLIRDGRKVVASMVSRGAYGHEQSAGPTKIWAKYRIQGDLCNDVTSETWQMMSPFEKCCWYWSYTNRMIDNDLAKLSQDVWIMIRLEDISMYLNEVLKFLELPFYPLKLVQANKHVDTTYHFTNWSEEEQEAFSFWCGQGMDKWYPGWREGSIVKPVAQVNNEPTRGFSFLHATGSHVKWIVMKGAGKLTDKVSFS